MLDFFEFFPKAGIQDSESWSLSRFSSRRTRRARTKAARAAAASRSGRSQDQKGKAVETVTMAVVVSALPITPSFGATTSRS